VSAGGDPGGASADDRPPGGPPAPEDILRVRLGHGANCSSIGSVVDTLFGTAAVGAALFAAIVAALSREATPAAPGIDAPGGLPGGPEAMGPVAAGRTEPASAPEDDSSGGPR
jgi:hypothetical protein